MKKIMMLYLPAAMLAVFPCSSQTLPIGSPLQEEVWRQEQVMGKRDLNTSFMVRPLVAMSAAAFDSLIAPPDSAIAPPSLRRFSKNKFQFRPLPLTLLQQYNTDRPYGWNDGSFIPARGYQGRISAGFYGEWGPLSVQLQPELVFAENRAFAGFPSGYSDSVWRAYYFVQNRIDNPERFGTGSYSRLFPGQSGVRLSFGKLAFGFSTENLWWGPGRRNSIIMSNNAPGFPHLSFHTKAPVHSPIGSFEWQLVSGWLKPSGVLPPDTARQFNGQPLYEPKLNDNRYLNGLVLTWQPKWTRGLHFGIARVFYQYEDDLRRTIDGYIPVIGALFKGKTSNEDEKRRDQLLSVFFRLVLPEARAEVYGEFARNDHAQNIRDLLLEPEHARAYMLGIRKYFELKGHKRLELSAEITQLESSATRLLRAQEGWYTHYQVRHGYTQLGQVLGAGIGPGSNSQTVDIRLLEGINSWGLRLDRIVRDNDFYYAAIGEPRLNYQSHWVDLAVMLDRTWMHKRCIYSFSLGYIRSINYQWNYLPSPEGYSGYDRGNLQARLSVSYLF